MEPGQRGTSYLKGKWQEQKEGSCQKSVQNDANIRKKPRVAEGKN